MKLTTILPLVAVMAATGCETTNTVYEMARARNIETHKQPFKPKLQPGTDMLGHPPTPVVYQPLAPQPAPQAPAPIIVTTAGRGTTMATQVGRTTVISSFGNRAPIRTPYYPPIDTRGRPIYYTESIRQP